MPLLSEDDINSCRDDYIVAYKISYRYRQVFNCGAHRLRVRETRYSKRRIFHLFGGGGGFSLPFVRRLLTRVAMWQQINVSVSGTSSTYLYAHIGDSRARI